MAQRSGQGQFDRLLASSARLERIPVVMGVLNVTPDSFSDGGCFASFDDALAQADKMLLEGADVIDVGAESTRPGSEPVSTADQIKRTGPVIEALHRSHPELPISIDTQSASVAKHALDAGASVINDISALKFDDAMANLVADRGVHVVLMHMRGTPKTMQSADSGPDYQDVVAEVLAFLAGRIEYAVARGIGLDRIIADPGLGFGKTVEQNLTMIKRFKEFTGLGVPCLMGASRKSFIGYVANIEAPSARLAGSLACTVMAVQAGATLVRVHDVADSVQAMKVALAVRSASAR